MEQVENISVSQALKRISELTSSPVSHTEKVKLSEVGDFSADPLRLFLMSLDKEILLELLVRMYVGRDIVTMQYAHSDTNAMAENIRHNLTHFGSEDKGAIVNQIAEKKPKLQEYFSSLESYMNDYSVARSMCIEQF